MCLSYDLNDHMLDNLDAIITLVSIMYVARTTYHELYHMDDKKISIFLIWK